MPLSSATKTPYAVPSFQNAAYAFGSAEAFLDQLVTWRELSFHTAHRVEDYDRYESLPAWAQRTLEKHAGDDRDLYALEELEEGRTYDALWNAA